MMPVAGLGSKLPLSSAPDFLWQWRLEYDHEAFTSLDCLDPPDHDKILQARVGNNNVTWIKGADGLLHEAQQY